MFRFRIFQSLNLGCADGPGYGGTFVLGSFKNQRVFPILFDLKTIDDNEWCLQLYHGGTAPVLFLLKNKLIDTGGWGAIIFY